nr:MAG TPA: minor tail protein [Caudoviricetes sp.]
MSTIVQIQVNVDDAKALSALTNIENIGKRLSSTPIEIKINSGDGEKVARSAISLAKQKAELAKASAKQAAAEVKLQTAQEKTKQTANNLAAQQEKTAQSANRLAAKQIKAASSTSKMGTEAQKTSVLTDLLGDRLDRIVAKQAAWQLIGNGIAAVKNAFSDALSTMKDVDSELATVRKVTGMSVNEMNALGDAAYSTASKYGVSANEYLESVSTFARAGYKEAAEGLGELAIKTQLVGDTNQDIATQFLLSADAAWKYNGNVEKLSLALDKANVIDNNYATSIQKIAEGLPIVANVAAMAGMSMDETMAMLGTITATTQESGTKAATAARALILNILGDTTTEISDGVTATEESVQSLSGILQKYAPDVVAAAKATGELINPMEAIEALSKAAKDGLISEADLMTMVSALGGKLRTNQLLALLENFDMYKSMMEDMSAAAGSADDELGVMLDTWTAKTNILKNTWTEFVSHLIDTSAIKIGLDAVTGFIKVLDSDFGHFVITVAGVTAAVTLLSKAMATLRSTALISTLTGMLTSVADFKAGLALLLKSPVFVTAATMAAIYGIVKGVDALTATYDEQVAVVQQLESEYEAAYGQGSRLDELKSKTEALTEAEQRELDILKDRAEVAKSNLQEEKDAEYDLWRQGWTNASTTGKYDEFGNYLGEEYTTKATQWLNGFRGAIAGVRAEYEEGKMLDSEYAQRLSEISSGYDDLVEQIEHYQEEGREIPSSLQEILDLYNSLNHQIAEITQTTGDAEGATENTASSLKEAADAADAAAQAVERYNNALSGLSDREEAANDIQSKFNKALKDFQDGKLGSIELGKFLDTYIPDDVKRELEYNIEDMMEWALNGNVGRILNSDNMFGEFYDVIKENVDSGALDGIVTMDDQGVIRTITSYKELAEALQITEAQAEALGHGLSNYMNGVFYTGEEAQKIVGDVGKVLSTSFSDGTASLSDFTQALSEITGANTSTELSGVFEGLMRAGALDWKTMLGAGSMEDAMQIINSYLHSIDEGVDELSENPADVKINFDADEAVAGLEGLEAKKEQVEGPAEVQATVTGAEEAEQKLNNVQKAKSGAQGSVSMFISADGASTAANEIGNVGDAANGLPGSKNIRVSAGGNALGVIGSVQGGLDSLHDKTVTINVVEKRFGANGGSFDWGSGNAHSDAISGLLPQSAQGTDNFQGGPVIVNDGAPVNGSSAELIMDKQGAYIANDGKITALELEPGARIFNAKETQEIFKDAKKSFISTFAGGTGLVRPGGNSSGNGGVYGGSYSGGTGAGGSTASSSSNDALKKEIDEKLDNLDKQIKLAQNRNDKAKEQALQQEAAKLIREYVQKYLDKGYSNTSNEVLDLLNKGYGYSDDLINELVDALESLTNATDEANKLAEKEQALEKARQELENTKKQRTVRIYNAATQQWEWVAKADDILKAQEKLAEAEKDYNDAKLEQELDAIRNGNIGDIGDLTMSPALRELISKASEEEQRRITDILHAISGGATGTVDATGESIFRSTDSHDVYYQFGDLKLSEAEAKNMTVKELADQLRTLNLT